MDEKDIDTVFDPTRVSPPQRRKSLSKIEAQIVKIRIRAFKDAQNRANLQFKAKLDEFYININKQQRYSELLFIATVAGIVLASWGLGIIVLAMIWGIALASVAAAITAVGGLAGALIFALKK